MTMSAYDRQRLEQMFDELDYLEQQRALSSESSFQRWLQRVAPDIFNRIRGALSSLWNWLRGR
jgi:hypothetical protein